MTNQIQTIQTSNQNQTNALLVPQAQNVLESMKYEIAQEFGVTLGADTSSRDNGRVGGEITKRLVRMAQEQLAQQSNKSNLH